MAGTRDSGDMEWWGHDGGVAGTRDGGDTGQRACAVLGTRWRGARWQGRVTVGTQDGGDAMAGCAVAGTHDGRDMGQQGTWDSGHV